MNTLLSIKGVGEQLAAKLRKIGISQATDLLFHLPRSYQDRTRIVPIASVRIGDQVLVEGEIINTQIVPGKQRMLLCHIADKTGYLICRFFHFNRQQYQYLHAGGRLRCFGEIRAGRKSWEMIHPEYQQLGPGENPPIENTLTPVYPTTEGLAQTRMRKLIQQVLQSPILGQLPELLPENIRQQLKLPSLLEALRFVHHPPPDAPVHQLLSGAHPMQQRLAFEELLAHRLSLRLQRQKKRNIPAVPLQHGHHLCEQLKKQLPFPLTNAQQRVIAEIENDLTRPKAMMRLLQGDVGAGKTLVALMAILQCVEAGHQAAIMAPTEILAEQHFLNFTQWLEALNIPCAWLVSKLTAKEKRETLESIANGTARVVIGTHALFQGEVQFKQLALVVIDEQHRFGVEQRLALQQKGERDNCLPHQLIMTATPIPRTLAMTAYADLDISIIDELPPGRTPVKTVLIPDARRYDVIERVRNACRQGKQAYWVCTLIEESEALTCQAAEDTAKHLAQALPELNIALVHGRMKSDEKAAVMQAFKAGNVHLLVATTVIEVGVDVPNSSLMIIENPERLGLSQLHQLRGRVGRGSTESFCVLLYQNPLSLKAKSRLTTIRDTTDGFKIAEQDLKLRGPGEVLGTRQTGDMNFRIAHIIRDQQLLPLVQHAADTLLKNHPDLAQQLVRRWVGQAENYAFV